jgi:hypothetical protein
MVSRQIRVVVQSLEGFVTQLIKKLVLDIVANLQAAPTEGGTPVDTGWARANWIPNIGSPLETPAGSREAAEQGQLPGASAAGVARVAATYTRAQGAVHITNNVPYILPLNEGSSKQAPRGFVQRSIVKAVTVDLARGLGVR